MELVILTHPDEDHIGGADAVLDAFPTDAVWINGVTAENESDQRLRETVSRLSAEVSVVRAGDSLLLGEVLLTVLYPTEDATVTEGNGGSIVVLAQCGETLLLLMGDAEQTTETLLLDRYGAHLSVDVLQVGHHGSNSSSDPDFLRAVAPTYAVISCGTGNRYGHPDGRALARLRAVNAEILRTDLLGDIVLESDGKSFSRTD